MSDVVMSDFFSTGILYYLQGFIYSGYNGR